MDLTEGCLKEYLCGFIDIYLYLYNHFFYFTSYISIYIFIKKKICFSMLRQCDNMKRKGIKDVCQG